MSGLSFCLALIGWLILAVTVGLLVARVIRRMDEIETEQHRRAEAWRALNLPSNDLPPCLRELDPRFIDWEERQWL